MQDNMQDKDNIKHTPFGYEITWIAEESYGGKILVFDKLSKTDFWFNNKTEKSWDDVPDDIKNTFNRLGIPEAEQKWLGGVTAQYESEAVYHSIREDLEEQGVIFLDMDSGLKQFPEIIKKYF